MERYREAGAEGAGRDVRADETLNVVAGDLAAPGPWQDAAAGADVVIPLGALVGMGPDEERSWRITVLGPRHALDAAARAGAKRFVHFSSIVTFGFDFRGTVD